MVSISTVVTTGHKHSENDHCMHLEHPRGGWYRFVCSCGCVTRWCISLKVAKQNAQLHIDVWTREV